MSKGDRNRTKNEWQVKDFISRERERIPLHGFWYCVHLVGAGMDIVAPHDLHASRWCLEAVALFGNAPIESVPSNPWVKVCLLSSVSVRGFVPCPGWQYFHGESDTPNSAKLNDGSCAGVERICLSLTRIASCPRRCRMSTFLPIADDVPSFPSF